MAAMPGKAEDLNPTVRFICCQRLSLKPADPVTASTGLTFNGVKSHRAAGGKAVLITCDHTSLPKSWALSKELIVVKLQKVIKMSLCMKTSCARSTSLADHIHRSKPRVS
jgi:hypothetical protein